MISKDQCYNSLSNEKDKSNSNTASKKELSNTETIPCSFLDLHLASGFFNFLSVLSVLSNQKYNFAFKSIHSYAQQMSQRKVSPRSPTEIMSLHRKRQIFLRCIKKLIFFGRANLTQKIFWRWKFLLPDKPVQAIESMKRNYTSALRALWNRLIHRKQHLNCYPSYFHWKCVSIHPRANLNLSETLSGLQKTNKKSVKIAFCYLHKILLSAAKEYFNNILAHKIPFTKTHMRILNIIFSKRLQSYFTLWTGQLEYVYDEQYEQITTLTKKKHFEVIPKPCVEFLYYDTSSYDPAFRAVFRNLGHFVKRRINSCFSTWKISFSQKSPCSIDSLPTNASVDYNSYKLGTDDAEKLKHLVINLYFIYQKTIEMPSLALLKWSQCATIRDLMVHKLREIIMQNKKKYEHKRKAFCKLK